MIKLRCVQLYVILYHTWFFVTLFFQVRNRHNFILPKIKGKFSISINHGNSSSLILLLRLTPLLLLWWCRISDDRYRSIFFVLFKLTSSFNSARAMTSLRQSLCCFPFICLFFMFHLLLFVSFPLHIRRRWTAYAVLAIIWGAGQFLLLILFKRAINRARGPQQKILCSLVLKLIKKRAALYFQVLTGALHTVYHESSALF